MMKRKKVVFPMTVEVSLEDFIEGLGPFDYDSGLELIRQMDLSFADVDFTEQVVLMLMESLQVDYTEEEWDKFIGKLQALKKRK